MIDYLEQLERDLVDAIEHLEAGERPEPVRRYRRTGTVARIAVAVALALAVGAVVLAGLDHPARTERPAHPNRRAIPQQRVTPIPAGAVLRLVGTVRRADARTWRGPANGVRRDGTLTLVGAVAFAGAPTRPGRAAARTTRTLRWRWVTARGVVSGCVANTIYRRPHGRWVWDGLGHITTATGDLRRYQGKGADIAGLTSTHRPQAARIIIGGGERPRAC